MTTETLVAGTDTIEAGDQAGAAGESPAGEGAAAPGATEGKPAAEEGKPAEGAQGEGEQKTEEVDYTFAAPEGVELDADRTAEFVQIAKDLKLPKEAAQKIVDLAIKVEVQRDEAHTAMVDGWAEEVRNDKVLGGDKLAESLATAKKAIDLGPPELKELLNSSGLGNHPAVFKWAHAIGKALSEDKFVPGGQPPGGSTETAKALYPNNT